MPSYVYFEDADDDIDVGPQDIAAETDTAKLNEWLDAWELKKELIGGSLSVAKEAGFPDQDWAQRATTAVIYTNRGIQAIRRRLRELGALTDGMKKDQANREKSMKDEQIRALKERVEAQAEHIRKMGEAASRKAAHRAAGREKERQFVEVARERMEHAEFMAWINEAQKRADAAAMPEAAE